MSTEQKLFLDQKVKDILLETLKVEEMTITFTKKDGTDRVMRCTLSPELLPQVVEQTEKTSKTTKKKSDDVLSVWDLDANGWRSFRWDSVKALEFSSPTMEN
jgi:hypothetical protein